MLLVRFNDGTRRLRRGRRADDLIRRHRVRRNVTLPEAAESHLLRGRRVAGAAREDIKGPAGDGDDGAAARRPARRLARRVIVGLRRAVT